MNLLQANNLQIVKAFFFLLTVIDEEVVGFLAEIYVTNSGHQEASDSVLQNTQLVGRSFRCQKEDRSRMIRNTGVQPHAGSRKPSPQWPNHSTLLVYTSSYVVTGARIIKPVGVGLGYLVGDDGDEGGVVGGDVGPPRHGSRSRMLLPVLFLLYTRSMKLNGDRIARAPIRCGGGGRHEQERGEEREIWNWKRNGPWAVAAPPWQVGRAQRWPAFLPAKLWNLVDA